MPGDSEVGRGGGEADVSRSGWPDAACEARAAEGMV